MPATYSSEFIQFLEQAGSYPGGSGVVEHIQTHISHVFIVSPHVYKFKKPVDFGFLDFSTLEKRRYYCEREVELNRRLCEEAYLGVVPVYRCGESWSFEKQGEGEPVEYAVWMKEFCKENFLSERIGRGVDVERDLDKVIEVLVLFYGNQGFEEEVSRWSDAERIRINTDENFEQTERFIGVTIDRVTFELVRTFTDRYLQRYHALFESRVRGGRVVDGHGDLRLEHIQLSGERVCIYDCIEFNDRFRYLDIASDIGFLAMDLDFNGLRKAGWYFARRMAEEMSDPGILQVIDFYKCYRAYVRGKVDSLESVEEEVGEEMRGCAALRAGRYFSLALGYALFGSRAVVLVIMGRVACGKSTLAKEIAWKLNIRLYSSDRIRKGMVGVPLAERTELFDRERVYDESVSMRTYDSLYEHALEEVLRGGSVVLDATFGDIRNRSRLLTCFEPSGAEVIFIEAHATGEVRRSRLERRDGEPGVVSDARLEDVEMLDQRYSPPFEIEAGHYIRIETGRELSRSLEEVFYWLLDRRVSVE